MASHSTNIEALRTAVYGEQVRGAMIELFEEDYNMVKKGISVGTDITSASSPVTGYVDGNVYINSDTLDIWKTDGTIWDKVGNLKGVADISVSESTADAGNNVVTITLTDGTNETFNVKNGSKGSTGAQGTSVTGAVDDGEGLFHLTLSNGTSTSQIQTIKGDKGDKGNKGDEGEPGRSIVSILMSGTGKSHPVTVTYSDGTTQVVGVVQDGNDGSGIGDMLKSTYDVDDHGYVDLAAALTDGTNTMPYSSVANKADKSTTLSGYGITNAYTKTEVDNLLEDKADASDIIINSVTTSDLTLTSKNLSLASGVKNDISNTKSNVNGIVGGDAYSSTHTSKSGVSNKYDYAETCIYNNKIYWCKATSGVSASTLPTNTTYWEETSLASLKLSLTNYLEVSTITLSSSYCSITIVKTGKIKMLILQTTGSQTALNINDYTNVATITNTDFLPKVTTNGIYQGVNGKVQIILQPNGLIRLYSYDVAHPAIAICITYI